MPIRRATLAVVDGERRRPEGSASPVPPGATIGIGSLPHRSSANAADFALTRFDVPTIPSLPRRSSAEMMLAQAVGGITGFGFGQYGSLTVDPPSIDADAPISPDLGSDSFVGFRRFLAEAVRRGHTGPVKWQFIGPVTLATALARVGVPAATAGALAGRAVRAHVAQLHGAVVAALGDVEQIVVFDEPSLGDVFSPDHLLDPDAAADLLSGSMASLESSATVGVHCCGTAPLSWLLSTGPALLAVPSPSPMLSPPCLVAEFIERGGLVVWGVVPTDQPLLGSGLKLWRGLSEQWCSLVRLGLEPVALRERSMISPACGLALHAVAGAERVAQVARSIGRRVHEQATLSRLTFGA